MIIGFIDLWIVIVVVALIVDVDLDVVLMCGPPADTPAAPADEEGQPLSLTPTVFERSVTRVGSGKTREHTHGHMRTTRSTAHVT